MRLGHEPVGIVEAVGRGVDIAFEVTGNAAAELAAKALRPKYSLDPADDMRRAMNALERGVFPMDKMVTHSFPLYEVQRGFETMLSASEGYIKGVITP